MLKNLSFRVKILLSQLVLFLIFLALFLPFYEKAVSKIVEQACVYDLEELIHTISTEMTQQGLAKKLERESDFVFYRVMLFDRQGKMLFDSKRRKEAEERELTWPMELPAERRGGYQYEEGIAKFYGVKFVVILYPFDAHGQHYVIRASFPYVQIEQFVNNFVMSFWVIGSLLLLCFLLMTWLVCVRLSGPMNAIMKAILPYQQGKVEELQHIHFTKKAQGQDDLHRLAETLNLLSDRIRAQVQSLREERNEKEAILESLGEGVMAVDAHLQVQYLNFIGSKMVGYPRKMLLGQPLDVVAQQAKTPLLKHCLGLLEKCQKQNAVVTDSFIMGVGRKLYLDLIVAPKADQRGAIIVLQDNSNHYRMLDVGKDFVANASHELRTPITIIRGFAETLLDLRKISPDMLRDIVEKILRSCLRMDNLVKSLLTLADVENLPLPNLEQHDLVHLMHQCIERLRAVHPEVRLHLQTSQQEIVAEVAPDLLELALSNLLENAVKYSPSPAKIHVEITQKEEGVAVTIADEGTGIPTSDLEHIFKRFYTVDKARARKLGGAGLGLSIVKTIIDKHDGTISVESQLGVGTRFVITLPAHHA